jgi:hypothetical protein
MSQQSHTEGVKKHRQSIVVEKHPLLPNQDDNGELLNMEQRREPLKYADHLYGGIETIVENTSQQQNGLTRLVEYFSQRAIVERDYGQGLKRLCQAFVTESGFSNQMVQIADGIKYLTERLATRQFNFSKDIEYCMIVPLTEFNNDMTKSKKRLLNSSQLLEKDLNIGLNAIKKSKQRQHKIAKELEQALNERKVSNDSELNSDPILEKLKKDSKIADMQYSDTVKQMRLYQKKFREEMKNILNTLQNNDIQLLQIYKTFLLHYVTFEEQLINDFQKDLAILKKAINDIDIGHTIDKFIELNETHQKPSEPIPYEPYRIKEPVIGQTAKERKDGINTKTEIDTKSQAPLSLSISNNPKSQRDNESSKDVGIPRSKSMTSQGLKKLLKLLPKSTAESITLVDDLEPLSHNMESSDNRPKMNTISDNQLPSEPSSPEGSERKQSLEKERELILENQRKEREYSSNTILSPVDNVKINNENRYSISEFINVDDQEFRKNHLDIQEVKEYEKLLERIFSIINLSEMEQTKVEEEVANLSAKLELPESMGTRLALAMAMNHIRADPCIRNETSFRIISRLVALAMEKAHKYGDANVGRLFLNMSQTFYRKIRKNNEEVPEYLQNYLRDLSVWKDIRFWEGAFFDALNYERKKSEWNSKKKWRYLDKDQREEVVVQHENMVFGLLGSFSFNMLNMGASVNDCRLFMEKMCMINSLKDEYTELLMNNIDTTYIAIRASEATGTSSEAYSSSLSLPISDPQGKIPAYPITDYSSSTTSKSSNATIIDKAKDTAKEQQEDKSDDDWSSESLSISTRNFILPSFLNENYFEKLQ